MCARSCNSGNRAFTLVELAVVVVALTILLSQTVPAIREARSNCRELSCQEKLGQIARAAMIYASRDPRELVIPIGHGDALSVNTLYSAFGWGGKSGYGNGTWNNNDWSGQRNMGAMHRPMNELFFKEPFGLPPPAGRGGLNWRVDARHDVDIYHCPSDDGFAGMHYLQWSQSGLSSYNHFGNSYVATTAFVYDPLAPEYLFSVGAYGRSSSDIPNPPKTIMYQESASQFAVYATNPELDQEPLEDCSTLYSEAHAANGWHGQPWQFNVAFSDGHVDMVEIHGVGATVLPEYPASCGFDGFRCICLAQRRPEWQMDALPAPMLATHKEVYGGGEGEYEVVP